MAYNYEYPYTDPNRYNDDWLLNRIKEYDETLRNFIAANEIRYHDPIEWDKATRYDKSTVVYAPNGNTLLSKQEVPAGIEYTDNRYWFVLADYNAQVELYRRETERVAGELQALKETVITPELYGASGDGIEDDTLPVIRAVSAAKSLNKRLYAEKIYKITNNIDLSGIDCDMEKATFNLYESSVVTVRNSTTKTLRFPRLINMSNIDRTALKCIDLYTCNLHVNYIKGFKIGFNLNGETDRGCADNNIYFTFIHNCDTSVLIDCNDSGWCNQNTFIGGLFTLDTNIASASNKKLVLISNNENEINGNTFIGCDLECQVGTMLELSNAKYNSFVGLRFEGNGTRANLVNTSRNNVIVGGYNVTSTMLTEEAGSYANLILAGETSNFRSNGVGAVFESVSGENADALRVKYSGKKSVGFRAHGIDFYDTDGVTKKSSYTSTGIDDANGNHIMQVLDKVMLVNATWNGTLIRIGSTFFWSASNGDIYGKAFGKPTSETDGKILFAH